MEERETAGTAFRDGVTVASVTVVDRARIERIPVPLPGQNRNDFKVNTIRGESSIRFHQTFNAELEEELTRLLAASRSDDEKRRLRALGKRTIAIDVHLDDGRNLAGFVDWPLYGHAGITATPFPFRYDARQ